MIALLETSRRQAARSVNAILTATYWEIGRYIMDYEQAGAERAKHGERTIERLSQTLTARFGRGFSRPNLQQMRQFYNIWQIRQTLSGESASLTEITSALDLEKIGRQFPLS